MLQHVQMMGSGPRTFPGGVSEREWKRMQRKELKAVEKEFQLQRRREAWERSTQFKVLTHRLKQSEWRPPEQHNQEMFETLDGTPSQRFLPPHAVNSTRLYRRIGTFARDHSTIDMDFEPVNDGTCTNEGNPGFS